MSHQLQYVPLWCKSYYSFLEGASSPEQYVEQAARLGLPAVALTDRDGVYGLVKGHFAALEHGVRMIAGSQITISQAGTRNISMLLLVRNRRGYTNLCSLITLGRRRNKKGTSEVTLQECCARFGGLHAIWLPQSTAALEDHDLEPALDLILQAFGRRFAMMVCRHHEQQDPLLEARTRRHARRCAVPVVAGVEMLYHCQQQRQIHDVLNCVRNHTTLVQSGELLKPNSHHALLEAERFATLFDDDPQAVRNTVVIAEQCAFEMGAIHYVYPRKSADGTMTSDQQLRKLTYAGARRRYAREIPRKVRRQLENELQLIAELDYSKYFLTMHQIVQWCEVRGILCQGRGSAANSAVCYCLGITNIDPVTMNLLFERFLSRQRNEPPDIDLDIEHERREEVIQHVYQTYGRDHAAMVATVIRYRSRSAVRDVGSVLGLPATDLQRISKQLDTHRPILDEDLIRAGVDPSLRIYQLLIRMSNAIAGFPRHLSIHPGGFIFTSGRIQEISAVENSTMPNRTVIQWEKDDIEAMKIFKVDLLGLGALSQLRRCQQLIHRHRNLKLDMHSIPKDDPGVYEMLVKADTTGVFQIESRAQMSMLPRLKPRQWYDLVVQIAIVRPGPITGGMVHPYLKRRASEEEVTYPHSCLIPVLKKTLGIPIFQEQVIKIAMVAADYHPGEADQLRRDMAAWGKSGRLERHREKLVARMVAKGIKQEFAEQVFDQIRGFGEYGFPESHSASFALIAYAASYFKHHYPAEFTCSLLNSQPMGFYSPATIIEDARRHDVQIRPIDIRYSDWDCTIEPCQESTGGFALRIGLRYVKGLSRNEAEMLTSCDADYRTADQLAQATGLSKTAIRKLAEAGALRGLYENRRDALWAAHGIVGQQALVHVPESEIRFAPLNDSELSTWDYRSSGVSSRGHMLSYCREQLTAVGLPDARTVNALDDGTRIRYAGVVICRQRPATAKSVVFMTLEDETGFVNTVFWPRCFERYSRLARSLSFMGVEGKLQVAENVVHLVVEKVWDPGDVIPWKNFKSRNFH